MIPTLLHLRTTADASGAGASAEPDALVVDAALAGAVAAVRRSRSPALVLRIAISDAESEDFAALLARIRPDAVMFGASHAADVQRVGAALAVAEARTEIAEGSTGVVPMLDMPASLFGLPGVAAASPRVRALGWDGDAIATALGARGARDADGAWRETCRTMRSLVLAAAAVAGVPAIDAPSAADAAGFRRETEAARHDGFRAKLATTPEQAAIVASVFSDRA